MHAEYTVTWRQGISARSEIKGVSLDGIKWITDRLDPPDLDKFASMAHSFTISLTWKQ